MLYTVRIICSNNRIGFSNYMGENFGRRWYFCCSVKNV